MKKNCRNYQKIAILISGHLRSFENCIDSLIQLKEYFDADVFIHTWSSENKDEECWHVIEDFTIKKSFESLLNLRLNPKGLLIEEPNEARKKISNNFKINEKIYDSIPGFYFQYYGIIEAYKIFNKYKLKNKINYDTLIRYRFDIVPQDVSSLILDIKDSFNSSSTYVSEHNWAQILGIYFDGIFISSYEIYSLKIELLNKNMKNGKYQNNIAFFPEMLYSFSFKKVTRNIKIIKTSIGIMRSNGTLIPIFSKSKNHIKTYFKSLIKVLLFIFKKIFKFKQKKYIF